MINPEYLVIQDMIRERQEAVAEFEDELLTERDGNYRVYLFRRIEEAGKEIYVLKRVLERTEEEYG